MSSNPKTPREEGEKNDPFPVVGIGASAGGLEPLEELFGEISTVLKMAFIIVQHSDPSHETLLPDILSRRTKLDVIKACAGEPIQPGRIYVCPSDALIAVHRGRIQLTARSHPPVNAIDHFFDSLARDLENCAVGIVLSGTGSDGSQGLLEIKERGGVTFAQEPNSAKFPQMPQAAIDTGCTDFILPPKSIALQLELLAKTDRAKLETGPKVVSFREDDKDFKSLLALIHKQLRIDFSQYKYGTVSRRISRRMALNNIHNLKDFETFLRSNPEALNEVGQDILIQVTKFFREPEVFETLKEKIFPEMIKNRTSGDPIRIWIPGCSSGEEVYSLLISLVEFLENSKLHFPVQLFGTDLNDLAVGKARTGAYTPSIEQDVNAERLRKFFSRTGMFYQIHKSLRDMCIFAKHNIVTDPPFGKLDLISCRNVLIYLQGRLQNRALSIFHYALKARGVLLLGNAETVGEVAGLYSLLDSKHRIYEKKPLASRLFFDFVGAHNTAEKISAPSQASAPVELASKGVQMQRDADRFLMGEFVPPCVLVTDSLEVIQFRGQTGPFFEHSPGFASFELFGMLKEGLAAEVRKCVETARKKRVSARKDDIRIRFNDDFKKVSVEVFPMALPSTGEQYFILLFEDASSPHFKAARIRRSIKKSVRPTKEDAEEFLALRAELTSTKEYLQSVNEEKEAMNEELKAANEEITSSNEELQSTNEELHSAKEELQSTNEELLTVNEELKMRNQDLSMLNDDLSNLFNSLNSAMVLLTRDLRVRRFTPMAETLLRLIPADVGRSINDIRPNVEIRDLQSLLAQVIVNGLPQNLEVASEEGKWYAVQIKPYRTNDDRVDGAVLLFTDITTLKTTQIFSDAVESIISHPLIVLDGNLVVKRANQKFYRTFQTAPRDTENLYFYDLADGQWNIPELRKLLEKILTTESEFHDFVITRKFKKLGEITMRLSGRRLLYQHKSTETILLTMVL